MSERLTTHGRRVPGTGSVRFTASGKWRATLSQRNGPTENLGVFDSRREAEAVLAARLREREVQS